MVPEDRKASTHEAMTTFTCQIHENKVGNDGLFSQREIIVVVCAKPVEIRTFMGYTADCEKRKCKLVVIIIRLVLM